MNFQLQNFQLYNKALQDWSLGKQQILTVNCFPRDQSLRACLHGGGGPQVGEVTCLGGVQKVTLLYMQSYNLAIPGCTFSRLLNGR